MSGAYDFTMDSIEGQAFPLSQLEGQLSLVVNVATRWGLTPQYAGLRTLHEQHDGFQVLAFPCNQFGAQEPGTNDEILAFATDEYGVTFPMFAKIEVNGDGACDLYKFLKSGHPDEDGNEDVAWNFTKFLVGRDGQVLARFAPQVTPEEIGKALPEYL